MGVLTGSRCGCWLSCLGRLRSHVEGRGSWQLYASGGGGGWRLEGAWLQIGESCCKLLYIVYWTVYRTIAEEGKMPLSDVYVCFPLPHPPDLIIASGRFPAIPIGHRAVHYVRVRLPGTATPASPTTKTPKHQEIKPRDPPEHGFFLASPHPRCFADIFPLLFEMPDSP